MRLIFFLLVAILVILLFRSFLPVLEKSGTGLEGAVFELFHTKPNPNDETVRLLEENQDLRKKLVELESLKKENQALKDQFQTGSLPTNILLPARIISAPSFIPGLTQPDFFILDRGKDGRVEKGQAVVFKNNLVGQITEVSKNRSKVRLLREKDFSLPGRTMETGALGVVEGGDQLVFGNVTLSEELKVSDLVLTYGNPSDIIMGKIVSVERKPSSLFQTAKIDSLLSFSKLFMVYVVVGSK